MDHSRAHLMEFTVDPIETIIIESKFDHEEKHGSMNKGENRMHSKEQQQQTEYFKELSEVIRNYGEVILFGPTEAKAELYNILKADHRFENIKIEVKQSDKMTQNQEHAFVRTHFSHH